MVEAMTVQASAANRNLGDSFTTDRLSTSDSGGLIFDLVAMAAELTTCNGSIAAKTETHTVETPDIPFSAMANGAAVPTEKAVSLLSSPEASEIADSGAVSVEALVAMDKTAKLGLESKAFSPKPETEWSISILPAGGKTDVRMVDKSLNIIEDASTPDNEVDVAASQISPSTNDIPTIQTEVIDFETSVARTSGSSKAPSMQVPTEFTQAIIEVVSIDQGTATLPAKQLFPDSTETLSNTSETDPAATIARLFQAVTSDATVAFPEPTQTILLSAGPSTTAINSMPLSATMPKKSDLLPSNTGAVAQQLPPAALLSSLAKTPEVKLTNVNASKDDTAAPSLEAVRVITSIPSGPIVQSTKPIDSFSTIDDHAISAEDDYLGVVPTERKANPARMKFTDTKAESSDASNSAMPVITVFPSTVVAPTSDNVDEGKPDGEISTDGNEKNRAPRTARRGDWKKPVFSIPKSQDSPAIKIEVNRTAKAIFETNASIGIDQILQENIAAEPTEGKVSNNLPNHAATSQEPRQESNQDRSRGTEMNNRFEVQASPASISEIQPSFVQNIAIETSDLSSLPISVADELPSDVTVETISVGSQNKIDERTDIGSNSSPSTAPTLSVFTQGDRSNGTIIDTTTFRTGSSTTTAYIETSNVSTPASTTTRTDNPGFIAQRDRAMEQQIISALRGGHDEIRLALYPAQLGQVTINLALDGQKVRIGMKTTSRDASTILLGERQSLMTALGHEGFNLESFDVTDDQPREQSPKDQSTNRSQSANNANAVDSFSLDITV